LAELIRHIAHILHNRVKLSALDDDLVVFLENFAAHFRKQIDEFDVALFGVFPQAAYRNFAFTDGCGKEEKRSAAVIALDNYFNAGIFLSSGNSYLFVFLFSVCTPNSAIICV
jgi:hypothetical protein